MRVSLKMGASLPFTCFLQIDILYPALIPKCCGIFRHRDDTGMLLNKMAEVHGNRKTRYINNILKSWNKVHTV